MIPFDFEYVRSASVNEAVSVFAQADEDGLNPVYYAGGTEIITLCREMKMKPDVVIDIKSIPECYQQQQNSEIIYGAGLSLNHIAAGTESELLSQSFSAIADHTIRNRLTLGGNILGQLPFREAVLPFLVLDGKAQATGPNGTRQISLKKEFNKRLSLGKGELVSQFSLSSQKIKEPFYFVRRTKDSPVDYPVLTACFSGLKGKLTMAVSGAFSYPIRDEKANQILNQSNLAIKKRAEKITGYFSSLYKTDYRASAAFRQHLLKLAIEDALNALEK